MLSAHAYRSILKNAAVAWFDHRAASMGAALAFYSAFSLAPLLLIVIAVAGAVFGADTVRTDVVAQFDALVGPVGADALNRLLQTARIGAGTAATVTGIAVLLIGATTVLVELQDDLDLIWEAPARHARGFMGVLRPRLISLALILGIGFLLLVSLVVASMLAWLGRYWHAALPGDWVFAADFAVSIAVFTILFAMLFKWLPNVPVAWHDVWVGSFTTAVLFGLGRIAIGFYFGRSAMASAYAAAASFLILLLWLYYSAQIFLFGAEFTAAHARFRDLPSRESRLR